MAFQSDPFSALFDSLDVRAGPVSFLLVTAARDDTGFWLWNRTRCLTPLGSSTSPCLVPLALPPRQPVLDTFLKFQE